QHGCCRLASREGLTAWPNFDRPTTKPASMRHPTSTHNDNIDDSTIYSLATAHRIFTSRPTGAHQAARTTGGRVEPAFQSHHRPNQFLRVDHILQSRARRRYQTYFGERLLACQ